MWRTRQQAAVDGRDATPDVTDVGVRALAARRANRLVGRAGVQSAAQTADSVSACGQMGRRPPGSDRLS